MTKPEQEAREMLAACPMCGLTEGLTVGQTKAAGLSWWSVECHGCCVSLSGPNTEAEVIAQWNQRARPTAGIDREVAIRLLRECAGPLMPDGYYAQRADAILTLLPTPAKTGERGAVIEECARIADERAAGREQLFKENGASINAAKAVEAEEIAKAIRALSQPLPDAPIVGGEGSES